MLIDWGGHFGRGDDYHYHMVPTHLETTVGSENPLAYALDGYPIYGYTEETLDDGFGRYDSDGNYRYHAVNEAPYYIPVMKGVVTLDPATTAPEDQIYPQPVQNPVRSSSDFKGVNGAVVNGLSQTGTNAFSFEYTVSDVISLTLMLMKMEIHPTFLPMELLRLTQRRILKLTTM